MHERRHGIHCPVSPRYIALELALRGSQFTRMDVEVCVKDPRLKDKEAIAQMVIGGLTEKDLLTKGENAFLVKGRFAEFQPPYLFNEEPVFSNESIEVFVPRRRVGEMGHLPPT